MCILYSNISTSAIVGLPIRFGDSGGYSLKVTVHVPHYQQQWWILDFFFFFDASSLLLPQHPVVKLPLALSSLSYPRMYISAKWFWPRDRHGQRHVVHVAKLRLPVARGAQFPVQLAVFEFSDEHMMVLLGLRDVIHGNVFSIHCFTYLFLIIKYVTNND